MKSKRANNYVRLQTYSIEEVLPYIGQTSKKEYAGVKVNLQSQRLKLFARNGVTCVECRISASFFALEKHANSLDTKPHFNLYGYDKDGVELLFTKDHIIPKSRGGKDIMANYQVMCTLCNEEKSDKLIDKSLKSDIVDV